MIWEVGSEIRRLPASIETPDYYSVILFCYILSPHLAKFTAELNF